MTHQGIAPRFITTTKCHHIILPVALDARIVHTLTQILYLCCISVPLLSSFWWLSCVSHMLQCVRGEAWQNKCLITLSIDLSTKFGTCEHQNNYCVYSCFMQSNYADMEAWWLSTSHHFSNMLCSSMQRRTSNQLSRTSRISSKCTSFDNT